MKAKVNLLFEDTAETSREREDRMLPRDLEATE
jgi:hypothetical protein